MMLGEAIAKLVFPFVIGGIIVGLAIGSPIYWMIPDKSSAVVKHDTLYITQLDTICLPKLDTVYIKQQKPDLGIAESRSTADKLQDWYDVQMNPLKNKLDELYK